MDQAEAIKDQIILEQSEREGAIYGRLSERGRTSRSAPVHFGPARRDAWLRGYDGAVAAVKAAADAAKAQAVATIERALLIAFPYWPDPEGDPERDRADDQVKCQEALALLVGKPR